MPARTGQPAQTREPAQTGRLSRIADDQEEWKTARDAVSDLMDRCHAVGVRRRFAG